MKLYLLLTVPVLAAFAVVSCVSQHSGRRPAQGPMPSGPSVETSIGRRLFLKNCAHCHGPNARGDEGPDLHDLEWTDEQIAMRIRNGKKGQMTAFAGKLSPVDIRELIEYLRGLK